MKHLFFGLLALAAPVAAIACTCMDTDDPAELRSLAPDASRNAIALVEVEAVTSYEQTPAGEEMKLVRLYAGTAPAKFRIARGHMPSSASCDEVYRPSQRDLILLYPALLKSSDGVATYRASGLCTGHMLEKPVFRAEIVRLMAAVGANGGERGR